MRNCIGSAAVAAVLAVASWIWSAPAIAAPPTVVPSPGYDARLAESRALLLGSQSVKQTRGRAVQKHRVAQPK
jgi:hypothetical protein